MKLSECVAKWLEEKGVKHVFGVNGGANLHIIHGIRDASGIEFVSTAHEQGAGFAADSYARLRGIGIATGTSGPGATNLVTAIAAAYQDSTPVIFIVGNCATFRKGSRFGVRNYGFQELEFVDMVRGITKSAVQVTDPTQILRELDFAYIMARDGRPGPVVVDIPDDLQRVDVDSLPRFRPHEILIDDRPTWWQYEVLEALAQSKRPVFVWGAGIRSQAQIAREIAEYLKIPVVTSWGAIDLMYGDLMAGGFGTHGTRAANFTVQNADLLIVMGCRLDTKATGTPAHFARDAKIIMVDIDPNEMSKMGELGRKIDTTITMDLNDFVPALKTIVEERVKNDKEDATWESPEWNYWLKRVQGWKTYYKPKGKVYDLMERVGSMSEPTDIIVTDTGNTLGWVMQGFPFKGQRFIHATNYTPMGYGLGAAIGAAKAEPDKQIICFIGDGGALMSVNELATIIRNKLNIKIILLDNKGHGMCRHTQRQWLGGNYYATSIEGGLGFPNWNALFEAFGFNHIHMDDYEDDISHMLQDEWGPQHRNKYPDYRVIEVDPDESLAFQARFGHPIEDSEPALSREELKMQMLIPVVA